MPIRGTGSEEQAKKLVLYWKDKIALLKDRFGNIPEEKRLRVYYAGNSLLETEGKGWWTQDLLTISGGINVAEDISQAREPSLEQLLLWNPQVIVVSRNPGEKDRVASILNNPQLASIDAVKNKRVYEFPVGGFWWNRPSPEAPLGFLWLAKKLYPNRTTDIDLKQETKIFFEKFYNYEITDDDYDDILGYKQH